MTAPREARVHANGIDIDYLESGEGPLVLLLHGFPDNAWTWEHQLDALATAGYRAVAPFLRGYPPTEVPDEPFDTETVARDALALIGTLGEESALVVGHDWGGLATFNAAALEPSAVSRAVSIGVGHPSTAVGIFGDPAQLHYAFHVWLFQLEGFGELAVRENDFALIDYLWEHWSSAPVDSEHVQRVKKTFQDPGVVEAALTYYRSLVRIPFDKPDFFERVTAATEVPMLVVYGAEDPAQRLSASEEQYFAGPYRRELVGGAGHFVHRERPKQLTDLVLEWFAQD